LFQVVVWVDPLDGTKEFIVGMYLEDVGNSCMTGSHIVFSSSFCVCSHNWERASSGTGRKGTW